MNTKRPTKRINYEALDDTSFDDYLGGFDESLAPAQLSSHPNPDGKTYPSQSTSQFNEQKTNGDKTSSHSTEQESIAGQTSSHSNENSKTSSQTEIDWREEIIQEMLAQNVKPIGIMKIVNKFIFQVCT